MICRASSTVLVSALLACDVASDGSSPSQPIADDHEEPSDAEREDAELDTVAPAATELVASGWLELADSPIVPWCGAVLVAPDVAITSARCVLGYDAGFLEVGFGQVGAAKTVGVERMEIQRDVEPELALAALQLSAPVVGADPAELTHAEPRERLCGIRSISYTYALVGESSPRWSWAGCIDPREPSWITAQVGAPNCHGDLGAGAFLPNGALLGVVVDARSEGGCVLDERIATVSANESFIDAALELSRP
ncbi:MAG: hypothetical protein IAG13_11735 [Deltaproteobacteria bacterium]|nr:hypothetical protein [Nannocystaceae bacterium]